MKNGKLQCKDIPDEPILRFLKHAQSLSASGWCTFRDNGYSMPTIASVTPGVPEGLRLAKMAMLIRRGLADGCTCGCRGDFRLTAKGERFLEALDSKGVLLE